jgi:hypothetical protein
MPKRIVIAVITLFLMTILISVASADLPVGVKTGDWIEYDVTFTGTPAQGHNIVWARMEIVAISGPAISVKMTSRFEDNTTTVTNSTLNLQTGDLIDNFIIPANLTVGQTFVDKNLGNVTIQNLEQQTYAGAARTVVSASTSTNTYVWDQATGVSVEGNAQEPTYSMHTIVADTNMWQPAEPATNALTPVVLAITIAIIVIATVGLVAYFRKKPSKPAPNMATFFVKP